jgi:FSR family fosmidomycin resistance protein-like MFS transporter
VPVAALIACAAAVALLPATAAAAPMPARPSRRATAADGRRAPALALGAEGAVLLVLAVVALRSYTGLAIGLPWKSSLPLLGALTAAVVLGKAAGGVLADRYGRARIGVGALAFSAPLLMLAPQLPIAGIVGMFAFNMTMPVTLVAVADVIPDSPGFAFGLASLALAVGAFPVLAGASSALGTPAAIGAVVDASAVALGVALWRLSPASAPHASLSESVLEVAE